MDDAGAVGRGQRFGDLDPDVERLLDRERSARNPLGERFALEDCMIKNKPPPAPAGLTAASVLWTKGQALRFTNR